MIAKENKNINDMVEKYLKPHQPQEYKLVIVPEATRKDDDWWYVVVQPSRDGVRSYDYASRLAEAEADIQDTEHKNVLLVAALPNE